MLNLEELKKEYIGKTINWLTVTDVYSGGKGIGIMFKCVCRCGRETNVSKRTVLSNHTKSCGCYKSSQEYCDCLKQWYIEHPDECMSRSMKVAAFYKNNPNKRLCLSKKRSLFMHNNPEVLNHIADSIKTRSKEKRLVTDYSDLLPYINASDYESLCRGEIRGEDFIKVYCSRCSACMSRRLKNLFIFSKAALKKSVPPVCEKCRSEYFSSKAEQEIANYIYTFYSGDVIRNSREIIAPLELDLYYPEKKIAVEFNGDYWHSSIFKDKYYHYNKFKHCKEIGITLVSIFESEWNTKKNEIKEYLLDLFNDKEHGLSFNEDHTMMNNNYPLPKFVSNKELIEDYYTFGDMTVFTCGYSQYH